MRIDSKNYQLLDRISIHDSAFSGYVYDYEMRRVTMSCDNIFSKKKLTFVFENVIILHLQSCSFWHGGDSILWMRTFLQHEYLDDLIKIQQTNSEKYCDSYLDQNIRYVGIEFTINSGDTLLIVCEEIDYSEKDLLS